ncbi:unnamed protein product [Phytophthora lilii]|uniref:Unnamed protein product n=1 Tax=Phytophthora lilii TaxID=2077276 RepID=A0A9W7D9W6_9STRA|nr:unnamed protein product [Phytophthora lilii]
MRDYELDGLMSLGLTKKDIKPWRAKTGIQYRVKVRNETGRIVYISDLRSQKKQKLLAKHNSIPLSKLQKHLASNFERPTRSISTPPTTTPRFFPGPQTINTRKDAIDSMDDLRNVVLEQTLDIPTSSYMLKSVDAFKLTLYYRTHKLGSEEAVIPEVIRSNRHVINFPQPPQSTKCLFYCIAYHLIEGEKPSRQRLVAPTKAAVKQWLTYKGVAFDSLTFPKLYKSLPPVELYQLSDVEDCFKLNIEVYTFDEETQEYSRAIDSTKSYDSTMSILSHNSHAMYITDAERFVGKHGCSKCSMIFVTHEQLRDHKKNNCQAAYIKRFVKEPALFRPATNKMARMLEKYGVKDVEPYTDHYLVYDFEAILKPLDADKAKRLSFTNAHIPVSVSVHDSLTNETKCFVNDSPKQLLINMFTHACKAQADRRSGADISHCDRDEETLAAFCGTISLIGFNSGRYDLNLIKDDLFAALMHVGGYEGIKRRGRKTKQQEKREMGVNAILSGSGYMCLDAGGFKMLDISKYVAAGTSLRQYLKAYLGKCQCPDKIKCVCQMSKGHFPYEYLKSFGMLDKPGLPPRSAFNSSLRSSKISDKAWKRVQWVWKHHEMKTLRDLLICTTTSM